MKDLDMSQFQFDGLEQEQITDLTTISAEDKETLIMSGVDVDTDFKSGTFLQVDHSSVHCNSDDPGVEVMDINEAMDKYDGLPDYAWNLIDKDKDDITRQTYEQTHGGYFIRTKKGAKIEKPVQSCLFLKANSVGQNVHNIVVVEEDSELHIITGCSVSKHSGHGAHFGISEFYIKKGGKLTFTMVHNWGENVTVRPRTSGVVEEGGVLQNNYILMTPVGSLQSYPSITLKGKGARARFNSVIVAPKGSHIDSGSKVLMEAPDCRAEIISRTISTGGTIINRGYIGTDQVPSKGHLECKGLILGDGIIHAIPELYASKEGVELSHEAAVGKIAQEEIEYLMARGMDEDEATSTIVRGFLNVDIMGLPEKLKKAIDKQIEELDSSDAM
ncbi:MAG: SufB/SufD family protein [Desulfovibrio sp.]